MRVTSDQARRILSACGVEIGDDFHALDAAQVDALLDHAGRAKYRKPRNASGSRGRSFHDMLQKTAARGAPLSTGLRKGVASKRWTVTGGRTLCFDGREALSLQRVDLGNEVYQVRPSDADAITHVIARMLNEEGWEV